MVFWITGKAKAGKSTAARVLQDTYRKAGHPAVILDGDDVRDAMDFNKDYSAEGRRNHQLIMASFASVLESQGIIVIVSCVSPVSEIRKECAKKFKEYKLIHIIGGFLWPGTTYEEPGDDEPHSTYIGNGEVFNGTDTGCDGNGV